MNKTEQYSHIKNFIEKNSSGRLETSQIEVEEEKKLALISNDDNSIEDEEGKGAFVNKELVRATDMVKEENGDESEFLLTAKERKILEEQLGRSVSFSGLKKVETQIEDKTEFNIAELLEYAEKFN